MVKMKYKAFWASLRILTGFIFLWAFLDKLFGFGINTIPSKSWLAGGSPTAGFLAGTSGTFSGFFHSIASSHIVAWFFMLGLLFIGLTFILGVAMKPGMVVGLVMLFLMWLSLFPPSSNPFFDYHWFYASGLITSVLTNSGNYFGFGNWWSGLNFIKRNKFLE